MSVFSGVRRLDNTTKLIIELGPNSTGTNGTFGLFAGNINTGTDYSGYSSSSRGTANAYYNSQAAFTGPITNTLNQRLDLTQTTLFATNGLYVNGTAVTPQTSTFFLRNSNTSGYADATFVYGWIGRLRPVAGIWKK